MSMLGLSDKGNNWKLIVGNFIMIFAAAFVNELPEAVIPCWLDVYKAVRIASILTIGMWLGNKGIAVTKKKKASVKSNTVTAPV